MIFMIPTLNNWSFGFLDTYKIDMPISGDVSNHLFFKNNENIQTTPIINIFIIKGKVVVRTKNGSLYKLGEPSEKFKFYVNIVKAFPEKYMAKLENHFNFDTSKNTVELLRWFLCL